MKPPSLKACLGDAVWATAVRLPIALLLVIYSVMSIKYEALVPLEDFLAVLKRYFSDSHTWIYWAVMWPLLLFVLTGYPYFRTRNPRYIAKQEAYERMQAERAAKQAAANEPGAADKPGNDKTS